MRKQVNMQTGVVTVFEDDAPSFKTPREVAMDAWVAQMAALDVYMPRPLEDHILNDHGGVAGGQFQQDKYDEKRALRAQQPE